MKIPGIGEVNKTWAIAGGTALVGIVGYAYYKNKKTKAANAAALAAANAAQSSQDYSSTGDTGTASPDYGTNYGGLYAGYGGVDPNTNMPYAYENYLGYGQSSSTSTITTNSQWVTQAEQDGQTLYGATNALAVSAVSKYMSQTTQGLQPSEYQLMQSIIAELGTPPTGGPYRLIQATGTIGGGNPPKGPPYGPVSGGGYGGTGFNVLAPGMTIQVPTKAGSTSYVVQKGDTLDSIAKKFGIGAEHLASYLLSQGIV